MSNDQSEPPGTPLEGVTGRTPASEVPAAAAPEPLRYDPEAAPLVAEPGPGVLRIPSVAAPKIPLRLDDVAPPSASEAGGALSSVVAAREASVRASSASGEHVQAPKQFAKDFIEASFGGVPDPARPSANAPVASRPEKPATAAPTPLQSSSGPVRVKTEKTIKAKRSVLAGKYLLKREIAKGAMGRVFLAEQIALRREVAVKVMLPKYGGPDFDKRFMLEARAVASLSHPNIVTVHDYGKVDDDLLYMAMEYLDGPTLGRFVSQNGAMPLGRACNVVLQIARALRVAHKAGMIHRDLKPGNVIVLTDEDDGDTVKVLDFGLAKMMETSDLGDEADGPLTREGLMLGTPRYMAPEQITGKQVDARTDIYSLGAVFYRIVSGRHPFEGDNDVEILHAQLKTTPTPLNEIEGCEAFPPEINTFIQRCMARKPAERMETAKEFMRELKQVVMAAITDPAYRNVLTVGGKDGLSSSLINVPSIASDAGSSDSRRIFLSELGSSTAETPLLDSAEMATPAPVAASDLPVAAAEMASIPSEPTNNTWPIAAAVLLLALIVGAGFVFLGGRDTSARPGDPVPVATAPSPRKVDEPATPPPSSRKEAPKKAEPRSATDEKAPDEGAFASGAADERAEEAAPTASSSAKANSASTPRSRSRKNRKPRRTARRKNDGASDERASSGSTPTPSNSTTVDGTRLAAPSEGGRNRGTRGSDSVKVGGVELASPEAVERSDSRRGRGRTAEKVTGGDVTLADDYQ